MNPGERFRDWIDSIARAWQERLHNWLGNMLSFGFDTFFKVVGKSAAPKLLPLINRIEATGKVPPELQPLLDELKKPTGEMAAMFANHAGSSLIGGAIGKIIDALLLPLAYAANASTQNVILSEGQYALLKQRHLITDDHFAQMMRWLGHNEEDIHFLKELLKVKLDPMTWVTLKRRGYKEWSPIADDLHDQGWDEARIEALNVATQAYPNLSDIVRFYAREAFEENMIKRYGLREELPPYKGTLFEKVGVSEKIAELYWIAHWEHASWNQVIEMLHRGELTHDEVYEWFKVVEIPPYWREKLINISYNVPTRVDVRRFYDMRTINEVRLREIYAGLGYHGKDLDDYVLWTKIYVDLPDLLARWKNGWISLEEVRSTLIADGMLPEAADELIQTKVKAVEPGSTAEGKELTKAEIYKGVKQKVITYEQGVDLLMDLDYSRDQADYLLATNVAVLTGSPEMYSDFKDITQKYRKALGVSSTPVTEELKLAGAKVVELTREIQALQAAIKEEEDKLVTQEILPSTATARRDELRVALHRGETALEHARSEYNKQLAIYRHSPPPSTTH